MPSVCHYIVVICAFYFLMRHRGHHDGCLMLNRKCLPFRSTWFHLCFHRGWCCPVVCASLFHVIVLSFGFWLLIVSLVWLRGISIFFSLYYNSIRGIMFILHDRLHSFVTRKDSTRPSVLLFPLRNELMQSVMLYRNKCVVLCLYMHIKYLWHCKVIENKIDLNHLYYMY